MGMTAAPGLGNSAARPPRGRAGIGLAPVRGPA